MQYSQSSANDGCVLAYQTSHAPAPPPTTPAATAEATVRPNTCILLMHGFSGSSAYFTRNFAALRDAGYWVVAPDMRGHGRSGRGRGGYHVARLAADLRDLLTHLRSIDSASASASPSSASKVHSGDSNGKGEKAANTLRFIPVGCSIGAAVLWTYVELFGESADFAGFVFVDQAPLQDRSAFSGSGDGGKWDETRAHRGCYDEATLHAAQEALLRDPAGAHANLVAECLGYRYKPEAGDSPSDPAARDDDERFFTQISGQCDPEWLARLLADHTRYDHREAIEDGIDVPTLVMAGRRTACFPLEGVRETVRLIEKNKKNRPGLVTWSVFDTGHWLFYEEPERFNREIVEFVRSCTGTTPTTTPATSTD